MAAPKKAKPPMPPWLAGTVVGVVSGVGLLSMVVAHHLAPGSSPLEQQVAGHLGRERQQPAAARYADVPAEIARLAAWESDPDFARLPPEKQEQVRQRLRDLRAYQDFQRQLDQVPDPAKIHSEEDLTKTLDKLGNLTALEALWGETEAGRRHREVLAEIRALHAAVRQTRQAYAGLTTDGRKVLDEKDAPNLPRRARNVLGRAADLPEPGADRDKAIPDSRRLTYAVVFQFPEVAGAHAAWEAVRKQLEPLAALEKP